MNEGFNKFKKKIHIEALIKSLIIAIAVGFLASGITLIASKLLSLNLAIWIFIIIGLLSFLFSGAVAYLIIRPSSMKMAKRMDKDLNLNEKVQTMVAFKNEEGFMIDIQREDTNEKLISIPTKSLKWHFNPIYFFALVIGLGVGISSFAIKAKAEELPPTPPEIDYDEDEYTIQKLRELIEYVNTSNSSETFKRLTIEKLNLLIDDVKNADTESKLMMAVNSFLESLGLNLKIANTAEPIAGYLGDNEDANIQHIKIGISELDSAKVLSMIDIIYEQIIGPKGIGKNSAKMAYEALSNTLSKSPLNKQSLYKNDPLLVSLISFGDICLDAYNILNGGKNIDASEFKAKFDDSKVQIEKAIIEQKNNSNVAAYVELEIKTLFGMLEDDEDIEHTKPVLPDDEDENDDTSTEDENHDAEGGIGGGDLILGGNDIIFTPEDGYVNYGDVIAKYQAIIEKDIMDGRISKELAEFYKEYFNNLLVNKNKDNN